MHDLVSTEWLAGALGAPDLMVFDKKITWEKVKMAIQKEVRTVTYRG